MRSFLVALLAALGVATSAAGQSVLVERVRSDARGVAALVTGAWRGDALMKYGNWYGPGWWGGDRQPDRPGSQPPVDELDAAAMRHDFAYLEAEKFGRIFGKQEEYRLKAIADALAVRDACRLDPDPRRWKPPAGDPEQAARYRDRMITAFSYQSGAFQGAGAVGSALSWVTSPLANWELDRSNQIDVAELEQRVSRRKEDWFRQHAQAPPTPGPRPSATPAPVRVAPAPAASPPAPPAVAAPVPAAPSVTAPAPVAETPAPSIPAPAVAVARPLAVRLSGATRPDPTSSSNYTARVTGGAGPFTFAWYVNGERAEVKDSSGDVTVNWAIVKPGKHVLEVVVQDARGAKARSKLTATLKPEKFRASCVGPSTGTEGVPGTILVRVNGGVPPYRFEWFINGTRQTGVSVSGMTAAWPSSGTFVVLVRVLDSAGAVEALTHRVDVKPASRPAAPAPPGASGVYAGQIMDRSQQKVYRGLVLRVAGNEITGRMLAGKDQGTVLDWSFSGNLRTFRKAGDPLPQRKLAGEIRGTVLGVHPVSGSFLVNTQTPGALVGTWNVRFKNGQKWHGPFEAIR